MIERFSKVPVGGVTYRLTYTVGAMIEIGEAFGSVTQLVDTYKKANPKEQIETMCTAAEILSKASAAVDKLNGEEPCPVASAEKLKTILLPFEKKELDEAVFEAISKGLFKDIESYDGFGDDSKNGSSGTE